MNLAELGRVIAEAIDAKGYTLAEVEERTDRNGKRVSDSTISRLMRGEVDEPSPAHLYRLARVLDLDFWTLMVLAGYPPPTVHSADADLNRIMALAQTLDWVQPMLDKALQLTPEGGVDQLAGAPCGETGKALAPLVCLIEHVDEWPVVGIVAVVHWSSRSYGDVCTAAAPWWLRGIKI